MSRERGHVQRWTRVTASNTILRNQSNAVELRRVEVGDLSALAKPLVRILERLRFTLKRSFALLSPCYHLADSHLR